MIEYMSFEQVEEDSILFRSMLELHDHIFTGQKSDSVVRELRRRAQVLILVAVSEGRVVGYKVGYEDRTPRFYSWLGGVYPEFRAQGIASALMIRQHAWCQQHGYAVVRTHTKNKWRSMLILNLRHGFDVVGTYTDEKGDPKIILEKQLGKS